jgi:hypothetical protein
MYVSIAESRDDTTNYCGTNYTCYYSTGRYMAVMEVCYGMTEVVVGLVIRIVPVPVRTTEVSPATTLIADATFPAGIKVTTTDVDVTGRTMLYHYMGTRSHCVWTSHLVMTTSTHLHTTIVMHYHLSLVSAMIVSVTTATEVTTSTTLSIYINTCHAHHGCHYHHHVEIVALHNSIILNVCKSVFFLVCNGKGTAFTKALYTDYS